MTLSFSYISSCRVSYLGDVFSVIVIVVENRIGDQSSNPVYVSLAAKSLKACIHLFSTHKQLEVNRMTLDFFSFGKEYSPEGKLNLSPLDCT